MATKRSESAGGGRKKNTFTLAAKKGSSSSSAKSTTALEANSDWTNEHGGELEIVGIRGGGSGKSQLASVGTRVARRDFNTAGGSSGAVVTRSIRSIFERHRGRESVWIDSFAGSIARRRRASTGIRACVSVPSSSFLANGSTSFDDTHLPMLRNSVDSIGLQQQQPPPNLPNGKTVGTTSNKTQRRPPPNKDVNIKPKLSASSKEPQAVSTATQNHHGLPSDPRAYGGATRPEVQYLLDRPFSLKDTSPIESESKTGGAVSQIVLELHTCASCAESSAARCGGTINSAQPELNGLPTYIVVNNGQCSNAAPRASVGKAAPDFSATAVVDGEFKTVKLSDYKGKYVVLFFWPRDFTFVCPTEIIAFNDRAEEFRKINCEILGCSTDSQFTHFAWVQQPRKQGGLGEMTIPLIADPTQQITRSYGVLKEDEGLAYRGLFIIDGKGTLRQITINDLAVGRDVDETMRLVQAFQYTDLHGEVCPAGWRPGKAAIKPAIKDAKEFFEKS